MTLPSALYLATQLQALDRSAIEDHALGDGELMRRAGQAAFEVLRWHWPRARRIAVVCGPGNNGGDGYVLARLAHAGGLAPRVLTLGDHSTHKGDAMIASQAFVTAGGEIQAFDAALLRDCDLVVDAMFGIGLQRPVAGVWRQAVSAVNHSGLPVLALDIPSGLDSDSGAVRGMAVKAALSVSFIGLKAGMFTALGPEYSGRIIFHDLGVPPEVYQSVTPFAMRLNAASLQGLLPKRRRHAHKGDCGHVLVIGGNQGMQGAAMLAALAACRSGAGLVSVACRAQAGLAAPTPELMLHEVADAVALRALLRRATAVVLGPGLGRDAWAQDLMAAALESDLPMVLDADALRLLAAEAQVRSNWVLTPHPGEAAALLGLGTDQVQQQRFQAAQDIVARYGGVCVLKGAGSVIAQQETAALAVCDRGNPGMASGGMGDVLGGVIAALLAQGLNGAAAARLGVWCHAVAGDRAASEAGEIGLLASDVLPWLCYELNTLSTTV